MESNQLVFYEVDENVATIYLNNQPANALSVEVLQLLDEQLDDVQSNQEVKTIVITGKGKMFAAGADIKEFTEVFDDEGKGIEMAKNAHRILGK